MFSPSCTIYIVIIESKSKASLLLKMPSTTFLAKNLTVINASSSLSFQFSSLSQISPDHQTTVLVFGRACSLSSRIFCLGIQSSKALRSSEISLGESTSAFPPLINFFLHVRALSLSPSLISDFRPEVSLKHTMVQNPLAGFYLYSHLFFGSLPTF